MKKIIVWLLLLAMNSSAYAQTSEPQTEEVPSQQQPAPAPQPPPQESLPPGHVNLDFKDADIRNVLRVIALKGGVNIVAGPEVTGTVTVRLQNVPWEKALEVVLKTYGYVFERDGNVVRVTTKDRVDQEQLESRTFFLNYSTSTEVADAISELLTDRGKVKAVVRTNTIIVTDIAANLYKISQVIANLDRRTPQAYIDSKIVATQLGKSEDLGIDWNAVGALTGASIPTTFPFEQAGKFSPASYPPLGSFFPIQQNAAVSIANAFNQRDIPFPSAAGAVVNNVFTLGALNFAQFNAVLAFLRTRVNTKIVSNPRIVVLNNQTAKVQVGQQIYIPNFELNEQTGAYVVNDFEKRDVGVVMNVTPHINTTQEILVEVKPEVSNLIAFVPVAPGLSAPQFNITEASTQVLIKDGETIAIGGLMTDNRTTTYRRVPFLGDIPWIGNVFRSKREAIVPGVAPPGPVAAGALPVKVETLFFITVGIIDTEGQPVRETIQPHLSTLPATAEGKLVP